MADDAPTERIRADLNAARRERDRVRTTTLTTLLADIRNREIETGRPVSGDDVIALLTTSVKRRREAAEQMRAGGREELAAREDDEAAILQAYLPAGLSVEEVRALIAEARAAGAADVGAVMKAVMPRARGRFDGKELNRLVRDALDG
jgi:uncharacterized protein